MAFVPVPRTAQVNLRWMWSGQQVENTLYFDRTNSDITPAALQSIADDVAAWAIAELLPWLSSDVTLQEVYATDLSDQNAATATSTAGLPATPPGSDASVPNNVSICVSFRTEQRGRSFRGRNYVPAIAAASVDGNTVGASLLTGLKEAYEALLDPTTYTDPEWVWSVVSRYEDKAPRVEGVATKVTSVVFADNTVDSQRRRLPGRGR